MKVIHVNVMLYVPDMTVGLMDLGATEACIKTAVENQLGSIVSDVYVDLDRDIITMDEDVASCPTE